MDRISELPTEILHQILSLLPTKTAARTAVLSKPWLKACSTNPNLCFDESDFESDSDEPDFESGSDEPDFESDSDEYEFESDSDEYEFESDSDESDAEAQQNAKFEQIRGEFSRIVDNVLERYRRENIPVSTFKLCISFSHQTDCDGQVDKWLDIIAEKKVSQLALLVKSRSEDYSERYSLLADTIFTMGALQQLELNHCKILNRRTLLSEDKIKCVNLRNLTLRFVTVSESTLDSLISCCPQILTISFQYCMGFSRIRVSKSLPNLLSLNIFCCPVEEVHIVDAPKMLSFEYVNELEPYDSSGVVVVASLRMLNMGTCQNLRRVEFVEAGIDDTFLFELIPKLPFIKELMLHFCEYLENITISSSTLEVCSIVKCDLLVEAIFDVPKLLSLAFSDQYRPPSLSFVSASSQCRISITYEAIWDTEQLMNLRRSLVELHDQVVDLTLPSINKDFSLASEIDHPEVENLLSHCPNSSYSSYFDVVFSICWPKSLTLQYCDRDFGEFLRQQLLKEKEKEKQWKFMECTWKEYLMNAQIEYKKTTGDDWMTLDRKILVADARIIEEINTMCFKQTQRKENNKYSYISRWIPRSIANQGVIDSDSSFVCFSFFALFVLLLYFISSLPFFSSIFFLFCSPPHN
ncbi:hypothetical protein HAX54_002475 [Datura stramonium]|uniref:F-box domain-containing protein n=1 Tax=Datura stramonium TaxID=4076 RepID=A0ABS8RT02_DATST|nr:hypothetical protein [Datura stramonium]